MYASGVGRGGSEESDKICPPPPPQKKKKRERGEGGGANFVHLLYKVIRKVIGAKRTPCKIPSYPPVLRNEIYIMEVTAS